MTTALVNPSILRSVYNIPYSLNFGGSSSLAITFGGATADPTKGSILFRGIRRATLDSGATLHHLINALGGTSVLNTIAFYQDALYVQLNHTGGAGKYVQTSEKFRDTTKPLPDLLVTWDTGNGTAANRIRIYLGLREITVFDVDQRADLSGSSSPDFFKAINHVIGKNYGASSEYFHGQIAEVIGVPGIVLTPETVSKLDQYTNTYVSKQYNPPITTNAFRLRWRDGTSTTTLGYDDSGNGNNWTLNGMATSDRWNDSAGNAHAILNELDVTHASNKQTIAGGGLYTGGTNNAGLRATMPLPADKKIYFEFYSNIDTASDERHLIGIALASAVLYDTGVTVPTGVLAYRSRNGQAYTGNSGAAYGNTWTQGDTIGVIWDGPAGKLWFAKGNTVQNSGDPVAGTGAAFTGLVDEYFPIYWAAGGTTQRGTLNFGQRDFGNTTLWATLEAAGYKRLCASTLSKPAVKSGLSGFAAAINTGANIETAVATLRAGWSGYIEEFKNRGSSQSWKVRYSDDTANMLGYDSGFTTGKVSFSTPTGGDNYVGYVTRVGADYGVFTSAVSHTNGAATNVAHGLGSGRKSVDVRRTDADGPWYYAHPDRTSGYLLYLDSNAGETSDSSISVDNTNVTLASSLPSGTYRVTVKKEVTGLRKFGKVRTNNSADGPTFWAGGKPARTRWKLATATGDHNVADNVRQPYNDVSGRPVFWLNMPDAESDVSTMQGQIDFTAGGGKARSSHPSWNPSSGTAFWEAEILSDFKYSNAA